MIGAMALRGDEESGLRQVLLGLGALVVVTALVAGIVSAVALGAARLGGLGETSGGGPAAQPSLYFPTGEPTTRPQAYPDPVGPSKDPTEEQTEETPDPRPDRKSRKITLQAFPLEVGPGERITMTGVYPAGEGATLQVQRRENGQWTDFPVSATVSGGTYSTYILTSRSGKARFRMADKALERASNVVTVTIR